MSKGKARSYDPDAAREHVKNAQELLAAEVDRLMTSDGWSLWLKQQSKFHTYSWGNVMLIAAQCPHATHVKGYRGWQDMGRQVRKGEKAIRILAPRPYQKTKEDEDGNEVAVSGISFTTTSIFDIAQTDPIEGRKAFEPAPKPYQDLDEQGDEDLCSQVFDAMRSYCFGLDIDVTVGCVHPAGNGNSYGCYNPLKRAIWVKQRDTTAPMLATFIHELGHALTYEAINTVDGYAAGELVAESVSYVVCDWFGLEALEPAANYVAAWAERDSKGLKAVMGVIARTSQEIIAVLAGAIGAPAQAEEEERIAA